MRSNLPRRDPSSFGDGPLNSGEPVLTGSKDGRREPSLGRCARDCIDSFVVYVGLARFGFRFLAPSGPVDATGDVRF